MRTMALDIGEVRIGVAISDSEGRIATPLKVLAASDVLGDGAEFRRLVQDWEVEQLLCGGRRPAGCFHQREGVAYRTRPQPSSVFRGRTHELA